MEMSDCRLAVPLGYREHLPVIGIAADRSIYRSLVMGDISVHKRVVFTCHRMILQLGRQRSMRLIILGCHQQTGRILVDSVHNSRTQLAINA
ncbi:hypothetical protein D3C72_1038800 [compost metagenome]